MAEGRIRVASWNVNGLRACVRKGRFPAWLEESGADIAGLQETRALPEQLPVKAREPEGWHAHFVAAERKGYSGVALYSRSPPDEVRDELGREEFDREGRLQRARFGKLWVVNGYFPNGSGTARDQSRIPYKLAFYEHLRELLEAPKEAGERILVLGDFNTAHRWIDLARPKQNVETSGFRPEEREELDRWVERGWVDTFRHLHPDEPDHYTWWSQRGTARQRNVGWRIDYVLASPGAMDYLRDAWIAPEVTGSDHCPLGVDLDRSVLD